MPTDASIVRLIETLFAASADSGRWNDFLCELCKLSRVSKGAILAHDMPRDEHIVLGGYGEADDEEGNQLYKNYYWQFDGWTPGFARSGKPRKVALGEEVWPEHELRRGVFYNEFLRQRDICGMAGVYFEFKPGVVDGISLYRGPHEEQFDHAQFSTLQAIVPHIETALAARRRLQELERRVGELESALDTLSTALLLVDSTGRIVFLNKCALKVLEGRSGLSIYRGRLAASIASHAAALRVLIEKATSSGAKGTRTGGAMTLPRDGKRPLHILVSPLAREERRLPGNAAAAIFLDDPELERMVPADILRALFGLSPAETRLALSILQGRSLSESADLGGVGRETVKSQMSAVFAKTGTRRQNDLIRLLSGISGLC